jgi:undecaprenyl-diphosphatase
MAGPLRIVVNPDAGSSLFGEDAREIIERELPDAVVFSVPEDTPPEDVLRAAASGAGTLGIVGGDGSVCAAVSVALEEGVPLLVVPGGTLNHFAKALGVPTVDDAIDAAREHRVVTVDVCAIDDRPFVNNASMGLYPRVVDQRERLQPRLGKWLALVIALVIVLWRASPLTVEIGGRQRLVWLVFFGNCVYDDEGLVVAERSRLDDGCIDVRLVGADRRLARARLLVAALAGRHTSSPVYEAHATSDPVGVRVIEGVPRLAADGETFDGHQVFEVRKHPRALRVLRPASVVD